ncbi:lytic transglycosylase domain-containing protein [Caulobacter sp.]|uniref:lytic transglycosylase domain-containing protein n=1 Tax=Caulobacter sp. TaxID=78 RepID=UPI0031DF0BCA
MREACLLSLFGRLQRPFPVPAKTASAVARSGGQGRPLGRRALRASLDGGEHGRTLAHAGMSARTPRASRATVVFLLLILASTPAFAGPAAGEPTAPTPASIAALVQEASARFGLPVSWIEAVISAESGGDPGAISPKGAMGLMQLMPPTWRELSAELGLGGDAFDRRSNIIAGAAYLRRLYDRFGRVGFLAAYNAGPARYQAMLDGGRKLPAETLAYVAAVEARIGRKPGAAPGQAAPGPHDWRTAGIFAPVLVRPEQGGDQAVMTTVVEMAETEVRP